VRWRVIVKKNAEKCRREGFVPNAFAHLKFIAYVDASMPLFEKAGIADLDKGCVLLDAGKGTPAFIPACRKLRRWDRE